MGLISRVSSRTYRYFCMLRRVIAISKRSFTVRYDEPQYLQKCIQEIEDELQDKAPLSTSVIGMKSLLETSFDFEKILGQNMAFMTHFLRSGHPLVNVAKSISRNDSPTAEINNAESYPVPLNMRGMIIAMLGNSLQTDETADSEPILADVYGLISAAFNIHRNILPDSTSKEILTRTNKLAVLVGDCCLSKAAELVSSLDRPEIVDKVAETLTQISQLSYQNQDYSGHLFIECCESVAILHSPNSSVHENITGFASNFHQAYLSILSKQYPKALGHKLTCLEFIKALNLEKRKRRLIDETVHAFLPMSLLDKDQLENINQPMSKIESKPKDFPFL